MPDTFVVNSAGKASIVKDSNAVLDYTFDWTAWLDDAVDNISSADVSIASGAEPASNIAVDSVAIVGKTVVAWVSGGQVGETAALRCRITTDNVPPRIDDRTVYLKVKER